MLCKTTIITLSRTSLNIISHAQAVMIFFLLERIFFCEQTMRPWRDLLFKSFADISAKSVLADEVQQREQMTLKNRGEEEENARWIIDPNSYLKCIRSLKYLVNRGCLFWEMWSWGVDGESGSSRVSECAGSWCQGSEPRGEFSCVEMQPPHTFLSKYSNRRRQCSSIIQNSSGWGRGDSQAKGSLASSPLPPPVTSFVRGLFLCALFCYLSQLLLLFTTPSPYPDLMTFPE